MDFQNLAQTRQSVRAYLAQAVEPEKIARCLEAARLAPSACNSQPWHFIVIDEAGLREKIAQATFGNLVALNQFVPQAPVIIAIVTEPSNITATMGGIVKKRPYHLIDIGIAAEHFCLQAAAEGLGTCMLGWFEEKVIKKLLHVPVVKRIDLLITLGYPASDEVRVKSRKPFEEIVSFNRYP